MWTYLVDYLLEGRASAKIWWAHTLALVVFLPLLPHTKHLHLMLSPLAIFLKRPGFSDIPPLVGDEDFGLHTVKDITQIAALQAFSCVECGRCTEHCPAANTGKVLNPKELILGLREALKAEPAHAETALLDRYVPMEAAFQCTTCGACEQQCPVGIQHLPAIVGLRRGATNTGAWEDDYGTKLFLNLERHGNPLGLPPSRRDEFLKKNEIPLYDGTQEYLLWLGCMGSYDPKGREIVLDLAKVLRHAGISFGVLKKEKCTGDSARRLGNDLAFAALAESNIQEIRSSGAKKMLSICPHCVRTMNTDWKEVGSVPHVEHHTELLNNILPRLPQAPPTKEKIVYHDACYLGRYQGVYDEPRNLAARYGEVKEAARSRERSFCCGAGGGLAFLGEEKGERVNETRAKELMATGATVIGAACPFCNTMFQSATQGNENVRVMDLVQIAAAALPDGDKLKLEA
jgi:Fe-S oxidoreductase